MIKNSLPGSKRGQKPDFSDCKSQDPASVCEPCKIPLNCVFDVLFTLPTREEPYQWKGGGGEFTTRKAPFLLLDEGSEVHVPFEVMGSSCCHDNPKCGTLQYIEIDNSNRPLSTTMGASLKDAGSSGNLPFKFHDGYYDHSIKPGPAYITEITYDENGNETIDVSREGLPVPRNDFSLEIKNKAPGNEKKTEANGEPPAENKTTVQFTNLLTEHRELGQFLGRTFSFVYDSKLANMPFSHYVAYGLECSGNSSPALKDLSAVTANSFYVIPKYEVDLTVKAYFQKSLKDAFTIANFKDDLLGFLKSFSLDIDITEKFKGKKGASGKLVIENVGGIVSSVKETIIAGKDKIKSTAESMQELLKSDKGSTITMPPYLSVLLDIVKEAPEWIAQYDQLLQSLGLTDTVADVKSAGKEYSEGFEKIRSEMKKPKSKRKKIDLGFKDIVKTGMSTGLPKFTYTSKSELKEGKEEWEIERTVSKFKIDDLFGFWIQIDLALLILAKIPITAVALAISKGLDSPHLELSTDKNFLTGLSAGELEARNNTNLRVTLVIHGFLKATVTGSAFEMDIGSSKVNQLNYKNKAPKSSGSDETSKDRAPSIGYTTWGNIKTEFDAGIWADGKAWIFYGGLDASFNLSANFYLCDAYAVRRHENGQPDFVSDACCFFNGLSVAWKVEIYGGMKVKGNESKDGDVWSQGDKKIDSTPEQQFSNDKISDPTWRQNRLDELGPLRQPWKAESDHWREKNGLGQAGQISENAYILVRDKSDQQAYDKYPNYTPEMEVEYNRLVKYQTFYKNNKNILAAIQQLNWDILADPTGGTFAQLEERFDLMQSIHADLLKLGYPTKPGEYVLGTLQDEYDLRDRYQKLLEADGSPEALKKKEALQDMDDIGHETLFGARLFGARKFRISEREAIRKKLMKEKFKTPKK